MAANGAVVVLVWIIMGGALVSATNSKSSSPPAVLKVCTETLQNEELMNFCAYDLLQDQAQEFVGYDWKRMSGAALTQAVGKTTDLQISVSNLARIKTLPGMSRVMLNLCLPCVKKAQELAIQADMEFQNIKGEMTEEKLKKIQILVDNVRVNTGTCNDVMVGRNSLERVKTDVYQAYMASLIVTEFLNRITP